MRIVLGLIYTSLWFIYIGQLLSVINFELAQRFGLQEKDDGANALFSHLELWTARWDLCWLWTLPAAGILMLIDHALWPYAAMVGGGAYVDAGGRETAKAVALRARNVPTGSARESFIALTAYVVFVMLGALAIIAGWLQIN